MEEACRHLLAVETRNQIADAESGLAAILPRHRLRSALQRFEQRRGDDQGALFSRNFEPITNAQIIRPNIRLAVDFDESATRIRQFMNVQQIDDSFELATLDAQALFPSQKGRPLRLSRSRFVKDPQQRLSCLRVRRHLVEDAGKVSVE